MCCCHSRYCYIAKYVGPYRPETACTEVDDAASDSDEEGDGDGDDRQHNSGNDGLIARDNLMRAVYIYYPAPRSALSRTEAPSNGLRKYHRRERHDGTTHSHVNFLNLMID